MWQGFGNFGPDRTVRDHAGAEIAAQGVAQEVEILRGDPTIEAKFGAQGGEGVRGRPIAQDCNGGIARDHTHQQED